MGPKLDSSIGIVCTSYWRCEKDFRGGGTAMNLLYENGIPLLFAIMLSKNVALADMDIDDCIHEDSSEISSDYSQNENEYSFIVGSESKREIIHLFGK